MQTKSTWLLAVAIAALLFSSSATAQSSARAKQLFAQGVQALQEGRFADARDWFRHSLEEQPSKGAAFNLAVAYRGTGERLEAIAELEKISAGSYGPIKEKQQLEVDQLLEELRSSLGTLRLRLQGAAQATAVVDGRYSRQLTLEQEEQWQLPNGLHQLQITAAERQTLQQTFEVKRGSETPLTATLLPIAVVKTTSTGLKIDSPPPRRRASLWRNPWLWTAVGVVVAGTIVTTAVLLAQRGNASEADIGPIVIPALR